MAIPVFAQQSEPNRTLTWVKGMIESALSWVFSLSHSAGQYRNTVRWLGFGLLYTYWVLTLNDLEGWLSLFADLNTTSSTGDPSVLIMQMGIFIFSTFLHPEVLRHVIAVVAPYMLIHRFAAIYLADIFEKETSVASRFIKQAAFAEDYLTIRVRAGRLLESNYDSPIVQIGGPGYVTVELDSAAVFERPDGSIRVIGPTAKMPHGRAVIDDFERLRQCIDLRDIVDKQEITSRSKDGIVVKARDIQYSYSIYRGENAKKSLDLPYPFDEEAIKKMVKGVVVPVSPGKQPQRTPEWTRPLPGGLFVSINIEFANFINQRGLSEFFSSIGSPEEEALRQRAAKIHQDAQALAGQDGYNLDESPLMAIPFTSRPNLAETMFGSAAFKNFMKGKGLQVNWIGVGTWETPNEIIPENHLEAWKTSLENLRLGGSEQLNRLYNDSRASTLIQKINQLPINAYYVLTQQGKKTDNEIIDGLFEHYVGYLRSISRYFEDHQQKIPENINTAIEAVGLLLYHDIGSDYYACIKTTSRADVDIQGAIAHTIGVAFSARPLPGYISYSVNFDFKNNSELEFLIAANTTNATLDPPGPQKITMKHDELYIYTQFQVILLPGASAEVLIDIEQNHQNLAHLLVPLTP
jgi:hypothetical protein